MDSGYLQPGESLEDDYDMLRELLPEEVLGIMDQMFCFEVRLDHDHYKTDYKVDTDPRFRRWHGIWVLRSHRHFLLHCT